jgi:hypothetical protein
MKPFFSQKYQSRSVPISSSQNWEYLTLKQPSLISSLNKASAFWHGIKKNSHTNPTSPTMT